MLESLLKNQKKYNEKIRKEKEMTRDEWTTTYLLGIVSEIDEVLDEINWKRHKKSDVTFDRTNIGFEFSDLTKYILSLWELWDFTAQDVSNFVADKTTVLEQIKSQDQIEVAEGQLVVISDIDGTLGDWRSSFIEWLQYKGVALQIADSSRSLLLDTDISMPYPQYYELKEEFESIGGYRTIYPYPEISNFFKDLVDDSNPFIIITTARPQSSYSRIWFDTWNWLSKFDIPHSRLEIMSEQRILLASKLSRTNDVLLLEDDPGLIVRACNSGIKVLARRHPYNEGISHENVRFIDSYSLRTVKEILHGLSRGT